ncbi:MAG: multiheme c-type cytochrome [Myxococcota bacterium]|nr:multiheme c-type cytochrome [Myxococcota bacterium]
MKRPKRRLGFAPLGVAALVLLTGSGGSCSEEQREPTTPAPPPLAEAELPPADVRLLVITDLDGYLEPCGCTSRPLGGIDRMSARVRSLSGEGPPSALVAAGNLYFHGAPHGADAERAAVQERMRAETLNTILERVDLTAAAPGPLDFGYGTDTFRALAGEAGFPLLAAGVTLATPAAEGEEDAAPSPVLTATTLRRIGSRQVGFVGLSQLESADGSLPDAVQIDAALREAGRAAVAELRERGAELVVALVTADRRGARQVATGVDGVDVVVHGGVDEASVSPPSTPGGAILVNAGRQGQGLVVLDLRLGEGDGWTDASVWTRRERRDHLQGRIESLEARIAEWEGDDDVAEADVARQRRRLEEMRAELRSLSAAPTAEGKVFTARYEELPPEAARDPAITRIMGEHDRRVNDRNRELFADWTPEPAPEGEPHYLGSQACASCHGAAVRWWRGHAHGRAYATLEDRHKNFNLSCVGCHVTGYLRPGGSTVTHVDRLQDVGCEVCHGPGSQHVQNPTGATVNVAREVPESLCVRCHNEEHSDQFVYESYRQSLLVPGHGRPSGG